MKLSVVLLETAGMGRQPDPALRNFPKSWEGRSCTLDTSSQADAKNRAWRASKGEWVLFHWGGEALPPLDGLDVSADADFLCAGSAEPALAGSALAPPFALRRSLLEELDGFRDLPSGLEDIELGLRLREAGVRAFHPPGWAITSAAHSLDYEGVLALFCLHPSKWVLQWACDQAEGGGDDGESLEARFLRVFGRPVPVQGRHSIVELANHFAERSGPPLLPAAEIQQLLQDAAEAGLYGSGPDGDRRFERSHAANWLVANTGYFEAMVQRNLCLRFPPPRLLAGAQAEPLAVSLEGRYEVEVEPGALEGLQVPSLCLPLPVECQEQWNLELSAFDPPELEQGVDGDRASTCLALKVRPGSGIRVGYSFRCCVREGTGGPAGPEAPLQPFPLSEKYSARVDAILGSLFPAADPLPDSKVRARRIYDWILDHIAFRWSERAGLFALDARAGNCAHRIRLFSLLCQRAGLTVRERSGVLAGDLHSQGTHDGRRWAVTERADRGHPLSHVWAEVFLGEEGWLPMDFFGADSGRRMMTLANVRDPATRQRLRAWSPPLDDYYFGSVDPYRLHFGATPRFLSGIPSGVPGGDLQAIWKLAWATRHTMRTRISGLPPTPLEVNR